MAERELSLLLSLRDEASKQLKGFTKGLGAMESSLQTVQRSATIAFGVLTAGVAVSVKNASDLEESINAVNVVFSEGADVILDFGVTSAKSIGLATAEFLQLSTVTGALIKDVGLPMQEVADITNELSIRASDMASVFNTDVTDALSAINQAIRGETEAIRRYAGDVTDASVQTFLLSQGITKTVSSMTEQEKRLARIDLIMSQTAITAGDFANTSESLANQQRILSAQLTNVSAKLGNAFLPIVTELVNKIAPLITKLADWVEKNPELAKNIILTTLAITGLVAITATLGLTILNVSRTIAGFKAGFALLGKINLVKTFGLLKNAIMGVGVALRFLATNPIGLIITAVALLITGLVLLIKNWDKVKKFALTAWDVVKKKTIGVWTSIKSFFTKLWGTLVSFFQDWGAEILTVIAPFLGIPLLIFKHWDAISGFMKVVWDKIINVLDFALAFIQGAIIMALDALFPQWRDKWNQFFNTFKTILNAISEFAVETWTNFVTNLTEAFTLISGVVSVWFEGFIMFWQEKWGVVAQFFGKIWSNISKTLSDRLGGVQKFFSAFASTFSAGWNALWSTVGSFFEGVWDNMKVGFQSALNWIISGLNKMINAINRLIEGINNVATVGGRLGGGIPTIPNIPMLAKGGIVTRPTLAMIGEKGAEAVIPLNRANGIGGTNITVIVHGDVSGQDLIDKVKNGIMQDLNLNGRFAS